MNTILLNQIDESIKQHSKLLSIISTQLNDLLTQRTILLEQTQRIGEPDDEPVHVRSHKPIYRNQPIQKKAEQQNQSNQSNQPQQTNQQKADQTKEQQAKANGIINFDPEKHREAEDRVNSIMDESASEEMEIRKRIMERKQQQLDHESMIDELQAEYRRLVAGGMSEKDANAAINKKQRDMMNQKFPISQSYLDAEKAARDEETIDIEKDIKVAAELDEIGKALNVMKNRIKKPNTNELPALESLGNIPLPVHR